MNRTLRRPMFRMGGSTGEGITSGLQAPRQNYEGGKTVEELNYKSPLGLKFTEMDINKLKNSELSDKLRNMKVSDYLTGDRTIGEMKDMASQLAYKPRGTNINDFLIGMGLNLVSNPSQGNIFADAATAAKDPYKEFMAGKQSAAEQRYASESDLFKSMMEAQSDVLAAREESGTSGKVFDKENTARMIKDYITDINNTTSQLESPDLTPEKQKELEQSLQISRAQLASIKKQSPYAAAVLKSDKFVKGMVRTIMERLVQDTDKYPEGENDPNLYKDAYQEFIRYFEDQFATGGRVGLQMGGEPMQAAQTQGQMPMDQGPQESQEMPEELQNIDYDTLRTRLPQSITDDIVTLIANSAEAMEDFAMIQSQQDVDMFNNKYGVELVLPSEA
jgi:hypothetical protein